MQTWIRKSFLVIAALMLISACSSNTTPTGKNTVPGSLQYLAARLTSSLEDEGFLIKQGYFYLYTIDRSRYSAQVMGTAYGNNPVAPYVLVAQPSWDDEFVDPALQYAMGPLDPGFACTARFDPREADLILALLPPPATYFSIQDYLFTREGAINTADPIYQDLTNSGNITSRNVLFNVSPNPARINLAGSVGNSINNVVIENQAGSAFGQERYLIITPDQYMQRKVTDALIAAGVTDPNAIFTMPLSPSFHYGLDASADDFGTVMRYALPADETAAESWRTDLPMIYLRIRDLDTLRPTEPFPEIVMDTKSYNAEASLQPDLQRLVAAVIAQWQQPTARVQPFVDLETTWDLVGPDCIGRGMNCLADIQDTTYHASGAQPIDSGELYAVVGTLGTATGNGTYVSLGMYQASVSLGIASVTQTELAGTANAYAGVVTDPSKFYVYYLTRDCKTLTACTSITTDMVPAGDALNISMREYVYPGTARSADASKLLPPILVKLDGSAM